MKILTFSTLYPNAATPHHGVFVENRLCAYQEISGADIRVIAPVPWFPFTVSAFGHYADFACAPHQEERRGIAISHPRYFLLPKAGMNIAPISLSRCLIRQAKKLRDDGFDFDIIDAHYLYPDGVAAIKAGAYFDKPVVLTARGTDVSLLPDFPRQRRMILNAAQQSNAVICVAQALKDELVQLGAPAEKISVLRNGVDLERFSPRAADPTRKNFNLSGESAAGPVIISVGHLTERKGHHLVIDAMDAIPDASLLIAGKGEEHANLQQQIERKNLQNRVRLLGALPHDRLAELYSIADALVLASSREGWPNVLLEAMACGCPCIATPVWGNAEVIKTPQAGRLTVDRSAPAIAEAVNLLFNAPPSRHETRSYAEQFSWQDTAINIDTLFKEIDQKEKKRKQITRQPIHLAKARTQPQLIVTVDTEEIFNWVNFKEPSYRLSPPQDFHHFQKLCSNHDIKPLYFLTAPLMEDDATTACFAQWRKDGLCETGLHLHQWVTQPVHDYAGEYYSYQMNLPDEVHQQKLQYLATLHEQCFGKRAIAHRAGRYGLARSDYEILSACGITMDFSPSPGFDQSARSGPNHLCTDNYPAYYTLANGDVVYVTPVCGARAIKRTSHFLSRADRLPPWITAPLRLSFEGNRLEDLKTLTRHLVAQKVPVLTYSFHSSSLTPGGSPYAEDKRQIEQSLRQMNAYFSWFTQELGGQFTTSADLHALYQRSYGIEQ